MSVVRSLLPARIPAVLAVLCAQACTGVVSDRTIPSGGVMHEGSGGSDGRTADRAMGSGSSGGAAASQAGPDGGSLAVDPAAVPALGPGGLRRLTVVQYKNAVRALLGFNVDPDLEADTSHDGFLSVGATRLALSPNAVERFETSARDEARQAFADTANRAKLAGCQPAAPDDGLCARTFVSSIGLRAWRRPLTEEEVQEYVALAVQVGRENKDPWLGLELALVGILQSPNFLYRVELGHPDPAAPARSRLDDYEMATRLSFFFLNAPPTPDLLDLASKGGLSTSAAVGSQAELMMKDLRARDVLAGFYAELLDVDGVESLVKDTNVFSRMSSTLGSSMGEEVRQTFLYFAFDRPGNLLDLLSTRDTFVNSELASLYGLPKPVGTGFSKVTWPVGPRVGVMGQAAFLAHFAHSDSTSPTQRGLAIQHLLCHTVPDPPPGVNTTLAPVVTGAKTTMRERMAVHTVTPACAGCHASFDPLGLAYEVFDGIGAFRKDDHGAAIDPRGTFDGKPFQDSAELATMVRQSPDLAPCFVHQLFRFAVGRREASGEDTILLALAGRLSAPSASPASLTELSVALASSDPFRFVSPAQ